MQCHHAVARLALSAVLVLACLPCILPLPFAHNVTDGTLVSPALSLINPAASRATASHAAAAVVVPAPSTNSSSSLVVSSITSVSGCGRDLGLGTLGCNLTSTLTIAGTGFSFPAILEIAHSVNCTLPESAVISSTLIVTRPCLYYYPSSQSSMWDVRLFTDNAASQPLLAAISFADTYPIVASVATTSCNIPPYNSCDTFQSHIFTITGRGFLPSPLPSINFYFWLLGDTYLPCYTRVATLSFTRFECITPAFSLNPPLSPSTRVGGLAAVFSANWLGESIASNFLPALVSFSQRVSSSSSSSTGGGRFVSSSVPYNQPPAITRVSGCEDSFNNTRNCPYPWSSPIILTIYGTRLRTYNSSIRVWIGNQPCLSLQLFLQPSRLLCHWNTSSVNYAMIGTTPLSLTLNSSAGWLTVPSAVNVNEAAAQTRPVINSISGCQTYGSTTTNCMPGMVLTLFGEAFARYLPASLHVGQHNVRCNFPDNPFAVECPLQGVDLTDVPRNKFVSVALQLGERVSDQVSYVSFGIDGPGPMPSSSGGAGGGTGDSGAADADELVGMKLALLSMMIISLIVLVVALAVWVTGWWLAHRRSYVSQYGQAAVDARQVLLQ